MRGIHTATGVVERRAVAGTHVRDNGAAIEASAGTTFVTRSRVASLTARANVDVAARCRVQSDLIGRLEIDPFVDIDFTAVGPIGAVHPADDIN